MRQTAQVYHRRKCGALAKKLTDEEEISGGYGRELLGAARVVDVARVVPHAAEARLALAARVGDLDKRDEEKGQFCKKKNPEGHHREC